MVNLLMLRKDVLEQKVNQVLESVGYSNRGGLVFTVLKSPVSSSLWLAPQRRSMLHSIQYDPTPTTPLHFTQRYRAENYIVTTTLIFNVNDYFD